MKKRKKVKIDKLKYPLWFNIFFYVFTILGPLGFIMAEGLSSDERWFRLTFGVLAGLVLLWSLIYKFVITHYEKRLQDRKVLLEHDYEIGNGCKEKIKWIWFSNEQILTIINLAQIALWGILISIFVIGIKEAAITVGYLSIAIAISYSIAYIMKFIIIMKLRGDEELEGDSDEPD